MDAERFEQKKSGKKKVVKTQQVAVEIRKDLESKDVKIKSEMETTTFLQHCVTHFNCNPSRNLFEARNQFRIVEQSTGLPDVRSFLDCYFQLLPTVYLNSLSLAVARERPPGCVAGGAVSGVSRGFQL